jgi:hypothetical protein
MALQPGEGGEAVIGGAQSSIHVLHEVWAKLENEQHELAIAMEQARHRGADVRPMQARQARLLLDINAVVADIREAPACTLEDYLALLDVALEHEIDLAADIGYYGLADYPMITRLLRALAQCAPEFEFNSLRRWLSIPGQFEELVGKATLCEPGEHRTGSVEPLVVDGPKGTGRGPKKPR